MIWRRKQSLNCRQVLLCIGHVLVQRSDGDWPPSIYLFGHLRSDKLTCRSEGGGGWTGGAFHFPLFLSFSAGAFILGIFVDELRFQKGTWENANNASKCSIMNCDISCHTQKKPEYKCRYKCYKSWGMIILCQTSLARNEDYGMRQSKVTRHFDEIIFNSYVQAQWLVQHDSMAQFQKFVVHIYSVQKA